LLIETPTDTTSSNNNTLIQTEGTPSTVLLVPCDFDSVLA
jgi:hypothetical protein